MATPNSFQLGLLPERKMDWRTVASSYGLQVLLVILLINMGLIWPDRLSLARTYHVTELIPMPSLQPKPFEVKTPPAIVHAKLLPRAPVFESPKLTVPREIRAPRPQQPDMAPPKIVVNQFCPDDIEAGFRSPSDIDRAHRGIWQFRGSDRQCPHPEGANRRIWRSQWH